MADIFCLLMGLCDVVAGALIIFSFMNNFAFVFGGIMIFKGVISFL